MKSEWKISSNCIAGKKLFIVYRLLDVNGIDHSGNREYDGKYIEDEQEAKKRADELNKGV